jgi:hypothetical protein
MAGILSGNVLGAAPDGVGFLPLPLPLTLAPLISHYTGRAASSAADTASTAAQKVQEEIPLTVEEKSDEEGVWGSEKALLIGLAVVGGLIFWKTYSDKKKARVKNNRGRPRRNTRTEQVPAWQATRTEQMPMHRGQVLIGAPLQQKRDDYKHEGMEAAEASIQAGRGASAKARDTTWARRAKSIRSSLLTPRTTQLLEQSWKQGWNLRARAAGYVDNRRRRRAR